MQKRGKSYAKKKSEQCSKRPYAILGLDSLIDQEGT